MFAPRTLVLPLLALLAFSAPAAGIYQGPAYSFLVEYRVVEENGVTRLAYQEMGVLSQIPSCSVPWRDLDPYTYPGDAGVVAERYVLGTLLNSYAREVERDGIVRGVRSVCDGTLSLSAPSTGCGFDGPWASSPQVASPITSTSGWAILQDSVVTRTSAVPSDPRPAVVEDKALRSLDLRYNLVQPQYGFPEGGVPFTGRLFVQDGAQRLQGPTYLAGRCLDAANAGGFQYNGNTVHDYALGARSSNGNLAFLPAGYGPIGSWTVWLVTCSVGCGSSAPKLAPAATVMPT